MATTLALPSDIVNWTPTDKAGYYNTLLSQGYTDAAIRAAAGTQTDADWQALQSIAALAPAPRTGATREQVLAAYVTTPGAVANPDESAIQYWMNTGLGGFQQAVNNFYAERGMPVPSAPNVTLPSTLPSPLPSMPAAAQPETSSVVSSTAPEVKDYRGRTYNTSQLLNLAGQIAPTLDYNNLKGGVYSVERGNIGFAFEDAEKVLGHAPTAAEQVVLDMARHLIDEGISDLSQIEPSNQNRRFGSTFTGEGGTIYEIQKDPNTGQVRTQTWGKTTSDADAIAPLLLIGALVGAPYLGSLFGGASAAGAGAGLGATELAIAAGEGIVPLTAAQTATAGLTAAQLGALGSGIGLSVPAGATATANLLADAEFIAADAAQLAGQTGNNVAAIRQNLIAAGVDPIVAATAANAAALGITGAGLTNVIAGSAGTGATGLFTGGTAADLALGGITTTTGGALLPGTTVPGTTTAPGGTGAPGGGTTAPPGGLPPGVTSTLTGLLSNPNTLASLLSLLGGGAALGGGGGGVGTLPTQGIPQNTPEYYNQVQGFLNQYIPGQMPTQAQYLANWYGSQPGMLPTITEGSPVVSGTATTIPTTTTVLPTTTATTLPTTTADASSPLTAQQAADYYRSTVGRGLMSERDLVNELRAIGVPDSIMTQAQGLLSGGNAAPVYDKTYTATDIREAIQQTLKADPNVRKEDLKILAATTYGVDPFEFDRQWIEVAGNKFIDKYANTTDPIIRELVNNMRETQQIYENSSNAAAVNAAQNAAIAADLANPNFNANPADIAEAYRQSVGAGTMTETDFVNRALAMGATPSDLTAAQNILLGR